MLKCMESSGMEEVTSISMLAAKFALFIKCYILYYVPLSI